MIEAVNSVLQAAPLIRATAEQTSTVDSFAANPAKIQKVAQAPYVSPYISFDAVSHSTVLQFRDSTTGKVLQQIPSQNGLQAKDSEIVSDTQRQQVPLAQTVTAGTVATPTTTPTDSSANVTPAAVNTAASSGKSAATAQQTEAFATASRAGNTNAGTVSVFA